MDLVLAVVGLRVEGVGLGGVEVELGVDRVDAEPVVTALSAFQTFSEMKSLKHAPRGWGRGLAASLGLTLTKPSASSTMKKAFSGWLESPVLSSSMAAITLGAGSVHLLATCPGLRQRQQSL